MSNSTASGGNGTYNAAYNLGLPSIDMAKELATQGTLSDWSAYFTRNEYDMYKSDPLCFYANVESMYSSASASAAASQTSSGSAATISSAPSKRALQLRQSEANETCSEVAGGLTTICTPIAGSPQYSSDFSSRVSLLYVTALPDDLYSVHFGTPTSTGDVTATAVSSTICTGLDGGAGATTSYMQLKVREASTSNTTSMPTSSPSSNAVLTARSPFLLLGGPLLALPLVF